MRPDGRLLGVCWTLLLLLGAAETAAAQTIQGFAIIPANPDTGDAAALQATVSMPEDCHWTAAVTAGYGVEPELGPGIGWGIDLEVDPQIAPCLQEAVTISGRWPLGTLPVASAPGVLRLITVSGVAMTKPFSLEIAAGPAPGFADPSLHAPLQLFVQTAGIAAVGDLVAIADTPNHEIDLVDPVAETIDASFTSPGSGDVRDLAYDGTFLFASVLDLAGPRVYRLDLAGDVLDSFPSPVILPGPKPLEALAVSGGTLFGAYPSPPTLFAVNPSTHAVLWQRPLPQRLSGLAAIPEGLVGVDAIGNLYRTGTGPADGTDLLADAFDTGLPATSDVTALTFSGRGFYLFDHQLSSLWSLRTYAVWWAADFTLRAYRPPAATSVDVVRGDVGAIRQESGQVDLGPTVCLMGDGAGGVVPDSVIPAPGRAFFYLARVAGQDGSDESWGRSSDGFRRVETSPACP